VVISGSADIGTVALILTVQQQLHLTISTQQYTFVFCQQFHREKLSAYCHHHLLRQFGPI
jgi:hypothetical protein